MTKTKSRWWPNKESREKLEIVKFIAAYKILPHGRSLQIVSKSEKPDFIVRDLNNKWHAGIELTAVYLSDRSVPDKHMNPTDEQSDITFNLDELNKYKQRLIKAVRNKIKKAQAGYDTNCPLILSIYVNEYCSIYLKERDLEHLAKNNPDVFDNMNPFIEIVFCNLPNGGVFSVRPD